MSAKRQYDLNASLLEAAVDGDEASVNTLLDAGAHVDTINECGSSAVMLAAKFYNHRVVRLLLARGARAPQRDQLVLNTLFGAVKPA